MYWKCFGGRILVPGRTKVKDSDNEHAILGLRGLESYRDGGKNYQRTNRARCGSTGAAAPDSVNFFPANPVRDSVQTQPVIFSENHTRTLSVLSSPPTLSMPNEGCRLVHCTFHHCSYCSSCRWRCAPENVHVYHRDLH